MNRSRSASEEKGSMNVSRKNEPGSTLTWGLDLKIAVMVSRTTCCRDTVGKFATTVPTVRGFPTTSTE